MYKYTCICIQYFLDSGPGHILGTPTVIQVRLADYSMRWFMIAEEDSESLESYTRQYSTRKKQGPFFLSAYTHINSCVYILYTCAFYTYWICTYLNCINIIQVFHAPQRFTKWSWLFIRIIAIIEVCRCTFQNQCALDEKRDSTRINLKKKSLIKAIPSYQRRPSSLNRGKEMCTFPTNLHVVGRSARPTSRWASKVHRMMGKTQ